MSGVGSKSSNSTAASSLGGTRSPFPVITSQRFEPPSSDTGFSQAGELSSMGHGLAMSPSQGRISPERIDRPASPTKGLGGFVQSAMMKRSDSVNKRWSAQATTGLRRGDSIVSNRSGIDGPKFPLSGITPLGDPKPARFSRESTPASASSRPGSSHSNTTVMPNEAEDEPPVTATSYKSDSPPNNGITASSTSQEQQSTPPSTTTFELPPVMNPPPSPSKRWSPQKSSWLENAINKPESPKVLTPATNPQQPSWMTGNARGKQQRGSMDLPQGPNHKAINTGGLMRSPPPGTGFKPPNIGGFQSGLNAGAVTKAKPGDFDGFKQASNMPNALESIDIPKSNNAVSTTSRPSRMTHDSLDLSANSNMYNKASRADASDNVDPVTASAPSPKSPVVQPQPETPPKKDFKASLRSLPISNETHSKDEPEFKNIFGRLKRTQTQNYKAPDELKDNIMRGKAGLAATGGPKKTEHKDEFKESILKKKQSMTVPSASTKITSASSTNDVVSTPEAIKRRQNLVRSDSVLSNGSVESTKSESVKDKFVPEKPNLTPTIMQKKSNVNLGDNFASSLAGILQRGPSPISLPSKNDVLASQSTDLDVRAEMASRDETTPQTGQQLTHATKARARGPKRKLPTVNQQISRVESTSTEHAPSTTNITPEDQQPSIKNLSKTQPSALFISKTAPRPLSNITNSNINNRQASQPISPRKPSTSVVRSPKPTPMEKKPQFGDVAPKPSLITEIKPASPFNENASKALAPALALQKPSKTLSKEISSDDKERLPSGASPTPLFEAAPPSVKGAAALWGQSTRSLDSAAPKPPVKLPTRQDEQAAMQEAGLKARDADGMDIAMSSRPALPKPPVPDGGFLSPGSPGSPPLPRKKPDMIPDRMAANGFPSPSISTASSTKSKLSDAAQFFADVFDDPLNSNENIKIDTQGILDTRSSSDSFPKIKTLRKQILEIVENGKTNSVPSHQEHILFENSLYLCTHVFGTPAGQRTTEVYLWCGDSASPSAVEDAQLFAKRFARENNGKLILLKQGKETSNFFQALGGIVITRRGSSTTSGSATYMLCGRQHVGQIAFDEVDFDSQSLCSGFPYIISARFGKLYLWKGKGAGVDELGCARLIGMDLGLTGEIEELDEGKEPESFWATFPHSPRRETVTDAGAGHWHLKASCEHYATRLFHIDTEAPRPKSASSFMQWGRRGSAPSNDANSVMTAQIGEIVPFSHADVVDDNILVLDAFFEIFVIQSLPTLKPPPHRRSTKSASFRAALLFAQEYGILAASAEDRPFVPQSSVVFWTKDGSGVDEIPEGLKRSFRKWDTARGGRCKMLGLAEALEGAGASRQV
ncbi:MAG: hypothetical protein Q9164_005498 [Protoblastenia rupestris]